MATSALKLFYPSARGVLTKCYPKHAAGIRSYWRRNAFSELSSVVQSMENRMRDMDREMSRMFEDFHRLSPVKLPQIFNALDSVRTKEIPVVSTNGDGRTYRIELDMHGMKPEDINVTLKDHELTIVARVDETRSDGSRFVRENNYQYTLPKEVNPEMIRSSLGNGVLTIEAPLPALQTESKEIPVKIESSANKTDSKKLE